MKPNESETKIHFNGSFIIDTHRESERERDRKRGGRKERERIPTDL